jgi:hypothetical protein
MIARSDPEMKLTVEAVLHHIATVAGVSCPLCRRFGSTKVSGTLALGRRSLFVQPSAQSLNRAYTKNMIMGKRTARLQPEYFANLALVLAFDEGG